MFIYNSSFLHTLLKHGHQLELSLPVFNSSPVQSSNQVKDGPLMAALGDLTDLTDHGHDDNEEAKTKQKMILSKKLMPNVQRPMLDVW